MRSAAARRFGPVRLAAVPVLVALTRADLAARRRGTPACRRRGSTPTRRSSPRRIVSMPATIVADRPEEPRRARPVAVAALRCSRSWSTTSTAHRPAAIGIDILMPEPDGLSPERLLARAAPAGSRARRPARRAAGERRGCSRARSPRRADGARGRRHARGDRHAAARARRSSSAMPQRADAGAERSRLPHYAGVLTSIDAARSRGARPRARFGRRRRAA